MKLANIDVGAAQNWSERVKAEIEEIAPIINQVDNVWNNGPTSDTISGKIAEKVSQLDESWIRALDTAYEGIDKVIQVIIKIYNELKKAIQALDNMF